MQGFSDSRYGDIISVRPMRDYSTKEIAYYNHLFNVPSVFIPGLDTKVSSTSSITSTITVNHRENLSNDETKISDIVKENVKRKDYCCGQCS